MRYAQIRKLDISNGEGVGVALFVQGCHFHCYNCFNSETWDFDGGTEWTREIQSKFLSITARPYITRITLLGGEPLADENLEGILNLVNEIRNAFGEKKKIWIYSGYKWEQIMLPITTSNIDHQRDKLIDMRRNIISKCDVLVDGQYLDSEKDISLKWRGSHNQRVIDVQNSLKRGTVIYWNE